MMQRSYLIQIFQKNMEKNKIYFLIELNKNSVNINCYQNSILYKLLLVNKFKQFDSNDYIKLFFITLIKRIVFWPPTDADNLQTKSKDKKRLKNIYLNKYNDYLPQRIVTNSKLIMKYKLIKTIILNNSDFKKQIQLNQKILSLFMTIILFIFSIKK